MLVVVDHFLSIVNGQNAATQTFADFALFGDDRLADVNRHGAVGQRFYTLGWSGNHVHVYLVMPD